MADVLGAGPFRLAPYHSTVQSSRGIGLTIPVRQADCSGVHPSWRPFAVNVCDSACDDPEPVAFTARHLTIPEAP